MTQINISRFFFSPRKRTALRGLKNRSHPWLFFVMNVFENSPSKYEEMSSIELLVYEIRPLVSDAHENFWSRSTDEATLLCPVDKHLLSLQKSKSLSNFSSHYLTSRDRNFVVLEHSCLFQRGTEQSYTYPRDSNHSSYHQDVIVSNPFFST